MKKKWIGLYIFVMIIGTIALFGLFREKNEAKDFIPTAQIEKVFDTTRTDKFAVVFYKKQCPYCEIAKPTVLRFARKAKYPIYYIDTQSEMGKKLIPLTKLKYASTIVVFTLKAEKQSTIGQALFSSNAEEEKRFKSERWSYANKIGGKKVVLENNIKKAFGIERREEKN